ncbi:MAG: hypothetical protein V4850_17050 [Myxococcota bacterium]
MSLALLVLAACANQVTITPSQGGCADYDFADPAESTIEWEASKSGSARVWRANALQEQTGLVFDPLIEVEGKVVSVYEAWTGGETEDSFCYEPVVSFEGLSRELQVRWYLYAGDTVPYESVEIDAP